MSNNIINSKPGMYKDAVMIDVASLHPSMGMPKKDIWKLKWYMFWRDVKHGYHLCKLKKKFGMCKKEHPKGLMKITYDADNTKLIYFKIDDKDIYDQLSEVQNEDMEVICTDVRRVPNSTEIEFHMEFASGFHMIGRDYF